MNSEHTDRTNRNDPVEAVLSQARPRPVPPAADEQAIRDAVQAEWKSVVETRSAGKRWMRFAIAASVVVLASAMIVTLRPGPLPGAEVARIEKSAGTIYRLGDSSELIEVADVESIHAGQIIVTGADAALGLDWASGGSLRVDADTRIEFVDDTTVFLHEGRVYFDSISGDAEFLIDTEYGTVTHLGTQYMAAARRDGLIVSIREGRVRVDGRYHDQTVGHGKQVEIRGSGRPVLVDLPSHGPAWAWVEAMSPGIDLTNRSAYEFLLWVGRETGYEISYASTGAEELATTTRLIGMVEADPRTELRLRMLTTDLEYAFDADRGVIRVFLVGAGQR